ncbi:MAG: GAF domain-containing protein, partial [Chloroflexi bacterium]
FPSLPNNELGRLGQTMSTMRTEIAEHQNSLEQQVAQRTQELSTAFAFSQEIVRELEPEQLLQSVADHTCAVMKGTAVSVCVLNQQADTLELVASSGTTDTYLGLKQSTNRGLAAPVISEHKTVISEGHCANCGFLDHFPSASCIAAPLQVGGRSLGALCVVRPERLFDDNEARVLTLLANAAAVSLENTHLIAAAKQQAKENASLAERERLAADLHDNLAQTLGAMHLSIDQLSVKLENGSDTQVQRRVAQLQSSLKHAYVQVRMALTGLQEKVPDPGEFIMTIKSLLAEFEDKTGMAVEMVMDGEKGGGVTAVIQKQAVYIIREALTNVCRHAQATHAKIFITHALGTITIMISDNGIGFDPEQVQSQNHLGLTIMRARAERSRGQFTIQSAPGHGTRITVTFPTHSAIPRSEEVI